MKEFPKDLEDVGVFKEFLIGFDIYVKLAGPSTEFYLSRANQPEDWVSFQISDALTPFFENGTEIDSLTYKSICTETVVNITVLEGLEENSSRKIVINQRNEYDGKPVEERFTYYLVPAMMFAGFDPFVHEASTWLRDYVIRFFNSIVASNNKTLALDSGEKA